MSDEVTIRTNAAQVAADFRQAAARTETVVASVVMQHGMLLQARIKRHASKPRTGPPGPRLITGNYVRSINRRTTRTAGGITVQVGTNAPQGRRLEFGFTGADSLGRTYCVDHETEALTLDGWKTHDQIDVGTLLLTLNPETWQAEWQPAEHVWRYAGPLPVLHLEAKTLSAVTTPDHRWLIERYYQRASSWVKDKRTTATMPKNGRVPLAAKNADLPTVATVEDDVVELVAWFWTEGSYNWSRQTIDGERQSTDRPIGLTISQSPRANPEKCARLEAMLGRLLDAPGPFATGAHWRIQPNTTTGTNVYQLDRVACWLVERAVEPPHKALRPRWLMQLTQPQLELLLHVSMIADGHTDTAGTSRLSQANEARIRSWEMANLLAGQAVRTKHRHGAWITTSLQAPWSHAFGSALRTDRDHSTIVEEVADGVWCPTTANGTWMARRNGTAYFTGNSQPPYPHFAPGLDETAPGFIAAVRGVVPKVTGG